MKRREFITVLGGAAAWTLATGAQQPVVPVIGFLGSETPASFAPYVAAVQRGLNEIGYVAGKNVAVEYRWAEGQYDRLPALAADLVNRRVAVIVSNITGSRAAKAATTSIPIVFATGDDPVEAGLVASLNRPGGNVTGANSLNAEVAPKLIEFLHEIMPTATTFAALINPVGPLPASNAEDLETAARNLGLQMHILRANTERDIDTVFASLGQLRADGLVIHSNAFFINRNEQLAELALRYKVPTIFQFRDFATAGGLMSYGGDLADSYRVAGVYAGRILKGEKPADLPVQQSTKFELIINLKTAKALGLTVPLTLLAIADEIIE